ncbi:hypothetical protein, partial [Acidocella facilis]|uniref:hypothetical protein n=1 Tax=Acidocella facilis TaxID=525 RepID=UPI001F2B8431
MVPLFFKKAAKMFGVVTTMLPTPSVCGGFLKKAPTPPKTFITYSNLLQGCRHLSPPRQIRPGALAGQR